MSMRCRSALHTGSLRLSWVSPALLTPRPDSWSGEVVAVYRCKETYPQNPTKFSPRGGTSREGPPLESAGYCRVTDYRLGAIFNRDTNMGPQNQIILYDDVLEAVKQLAEAEGKPLDQASWPSPRKFWTRSSACSRRSSA
jgi:hypothetical protein